MYRYKYTIKRIKYFLDYIKELLNKVQQELIIFEKQIQKTGVYNDETFNDPYTDQIVIVLFLRQILELMLSRFIGNNNECLKDKIDKKNGRYKNLINQLKKQTAILFKY